MKKTTTIKAKKGPALSLRSKAGTAPLAVSNSTTVAHLSADLLDGRDGAAYRNQAFVYMVGGSSTSVHTAWAPPDLPPGKYLATYSMNLTFTSTPLSIVCSFVPVTGSIAQFTGINGGSPNASTFVNGSAYLTTPPAPPTSGGAEKGGGTMTASAPPLGPSKVVLTRLDDATVAAAGNPHRWT